MPSHFNRPALEAIHKECLDLGARKNHDYGAAGDAIAMAGLPGVVTRMLDKQLRLVSLTQPGFQAAVKDEAIRDTLMDMVNYASYAISLLDGTWGVKPRTRIRRKPEEGAPMLQLSAPAATGGELPADGESWENIEEGDPV